MHYNIPTEGEANEVVKCQAIRQWQAAAEAAGVDLNGFDPSASSEEMANWARSKGLDVGTVYARFSTQMQQSTEDQVRECVVWAARNNIFVPPNLISVDEGVKGSRVRRVGLDRTKRILAIRAATVLLVFKASRLFRQAGKGFQYIQEEVVDEGLRAVSVSQGIDTDDKKTWKLQLQIHGIMDDMLLDSIGDHVRAGQIGHFLNNHTTGAIGVGFRRKEVPGGRPTNRGLPRTAPEIDPEVADLIRRHFQFHLEGMPIAEGVRRWNEAGGPCDPRSTTGRMTSVAYRRLLSNQRLTGRWEFGRKKNKFSAKHDYVRQVEQPDDEVVTRQCEELRIIDDATFFALQAKLAKLKTGPRGPRKSTQPQLRDLVTGMFYCKHCSTPQEPVRFYVRGGEAASMSCRNGDRCCQPGVVRRQDAVDAVCDKLAELIASDGPLVEEIVSRSQQLDGVAEDSLRDEIAAVEKKLRGFKNRVDDLFELSGQGSDEDRRETKARLRAAQGERSAAQAELRVLQTTLERSTSTLSPEEARKALAEMSTLLREAAAGRLGQDAVYKARYVFGLLTGERIWVTCQQRSGRKTTNVRAEFRPHLVRATTELTGAAQRDQPPGEKVSVWLRKPPRIDRLADRVHQLIDVEGLSQREAAKRLQSEGHRINSGTVWQCYDRWYQMQGQPKPKSKYNNGKKRRGPKSA